MNKCYTYYQEIDAINNCPRRKSTQKELLDLCKESWKRSGWELIVLDHSVAEKHEFFGEYSQIINELPTVNPSMYDYSCFIRWLAMVQTGGGLMIDYDVINNGVYHLDRDETQLTVYQGHVPCVVYGTPEQYLEVCRGFCAIKDEFILHDGRPHTSDMIMLESGKIKFKKLRTVVDYPNNGGIVHCSQAHCQKNGKTKLEAMKELLA